MKIMLVTLLELELTDNVVNIRDHIYRPAAELDLLSIDLNKKQDATQFLCRRRQ